MNAIRLFWDGYHKLIGAVLLAILGALLAAGVVTMAQAELIGGAIAIATGATWLSARAVADPGNVPVIRPTVGADTAAKGGA
jgi:hypothetical protein